MLGVVIHDSRSLDLKLGDPCLNKTWVRTENVRLEMGLCGLRIEINDGDLSLCSANTPMNAPVILTSLSVTLLTVHNGTASQDVLGYCLQMRLQMWTESRKRGLWVWSFPCLYYFVFSTQRCNVYISFLPYQWTPSRAHALIRIASYLSLVWHYRAFIFFSFYFKAFLLVSPVVWCPKWLRWDIYLLITLYIYLQIT